MLVFFYSLMENIRIERHGVTAHVLSVQEVVSVGAFITH